MLLALAVLGCATSPPPPPAGPPDVVLVTLDTTRADRIGTYGHAGAHTPHLDALAARGWRFDRAYTTVPLTTPAHASILTGLYPARTGVHLNGDAVLPDAVDTLAERLSAAGYRTAASVSAFVTTRVWNLDQGFDAYFDGVDPAAGRWRQERPADRTVADLERWLAGVDDRPVFVWLHLYDPHRPWEAAPEWEAKVEGRPYDAEIAAADDAVGRLLAAMPDRPRLVVALGDHGESLGAEHGEAAHGMFLFEPTVRVPLIVAPPASVDGPVAVDTPVSVVDVLPTVLGAVGLTAEVDGRALSPDVAPRPVLAESDAARARFGFAPEVAVVDGPLKLMDGPDPRLYDVRVDPGERDDLADARPDDVARLQAFAVRPEVADGAIDADTRAQLEALGYATRRASGGSGADAKANLDRIHRSSRASSLLLAGEPDAAIAVARGLLDEMPELQEAWFLLARCHMALGEPAEAEAALAEVLAMDPGSREARMALAQVLLGQGRAADAAAIVDTLLAEQATDRDARLLRVRLEARSDPPAAVALARAALSADPGDAALSAFLGVLLARLGEAAAARPRLERAVAEGVPRPEVELALAQLALADGDRHAAITHVLRELEAFPGAGPAHRLLGDLWMADARWDEAVAAYGAAVEREPAVRDHRRALAQARFNADDVEGAVAALAPLLPSTEPGILTLHANILARQGRMDEARAVYAEAQRRAGVP